MQLRFLFLWCLVVVLVVISCVEAGGDEHHKHVKVYIPYHVKTIKHTHTIYKTIHHHDHKDEGHQSHGHHEHGHGGWFK